MELTQVLDWSREAIRMTLLLGGPLLAAALLVGLVVGVTQTLTQMQEPVVGLIPRLAGVILVGLALLPWLLSTLAAYAAEVIGSIPERL
jgi:flagellar biosynthesis protein FliQ